MGRSDNIFVVSVMAHTYLYNLNFIQHFSVPLRHNAHNDRHNVHNDAHTDGHNVHNDSHNVYNNRHRDRDTTWTDLCFLEGGVVKNKDHTSTIVSGKDHRPYINYRLW